MKVGNSSVCDIAYEQSYDLYAELLEQSSESTEALMDALFKTNDGSASALMYLSLGEAFAGKSVPCTGVASEQVPAGAALEGTGNVTASPWKPTDPAITSNANNRSAQLYSAVIAQFDVETNPRYAVNQKGTGDTYCNIFVWDVTSAMGAEIPHYYNAKTGEPMAYGENGANQMTANRIYSWLHNYGEQYGWYEVSAEQAQQLANEGHPVVTALCRSGSHGHVQVVCPSENGDYNEQKGVTIAQAGSNLRSYTYISSIYGEASLSKVSYFAHA